MFDEIEMTIPSLLLASGGSCVNVSVKDIKRYNKRHNFY